MGGGKTNKKKKHIKISKLCKLDEKLVPRVIEAINSKIDDNLRNKWRDFPEGTYTTMRATVNEVDLVSTSCYKCKKTKVLTFMMTKGAGSTRSGEFYIVIYPDSFDNICICHLASPVVISYFQCL